MASASQSPSVSPSVSYSKSPSLSVSPSPSMLLGEEMLENWGFEYWDSPTIPIDWDHYAVGTSSVNQDGVEQRSGVYCARLDVDALGSLVYVGKSQDIQAIILLPGARYRLSFWYKTQPGENKIPRPDFRTGDALYMLQNDGTWKYAPPYTDCWIDCPNTNGAWVQISIDFTTLAGYTGYYFFLSGAGPFSQDCSIWFDDVSLRETLGSASLSPSRSPSGSPSVSVSGSPSVSPSVSPSGSPSISPSVSPSNSPSLSPSASMSPSKSPSLSPSPSPSIEDSYDYRFDSGFPKDIRENHGDSFPTSQNYRGDFFNVRTLS